LTNITYVFDDLKPEHELVRKYEVKEKVYDPKEKRLVDSYKDLITRQGLPQGLSFSPLLANLVLENTGAPVKSLVMYADDGLLFGDDPQSYS